MADLTERELSKVEDHVLANLFELKVEPARLWKPDELGAILEHQLGAPLRDSGLLLEAADGAWLPLGPIVSFADVLRDPAPSLPLLEALVQTTDNWRGELDSPVPEEVATVLYFAAISAARVRLGDRISEHDNRSLAQKLHELTSLSWLDPATRGLMTDAIWALSAA
jgi:hypothetical protein